MVNYILTSDRLPTEEDANSIGNVLAWNERIDGWVRWKFKEVNNMDFPAWIPLAPYKEPVPEYRPFESLKEFMPFADRWIGLKSSDYIFKPHGISNQGVSDYEEIITWEDLMKNYFFYGDERPCGMQK